MQIHTHFHYYTCDEMFLGMSRMGGGISAFASDHGLLSRIFICKLMAGGGISNQIKKQYKNQNNYTKKHLIGSSSENVWEFAYNATVYTV